MNQIHVQKRKFFIYLRFNRKLCKCAWVFVRARFKVQYTKHTGDSFAFVGFFLHWSIFQIHNQCQLQSPLVIYTDFSQFHKFNKFWKLLVFLEGTKQMGLSQPN